MTRYCPRCGLPQTYRNKRSFQKAITNNTECHKCCHNGVKNSFFGKKHTSESRNRMSLAQSGVPCPLSRKLKMQNCWRLRDNPMKGKSVYSIWVTKFGKDVADKKQLELCKKRSLNASGKNNPMYGKPSPQGSGNGYKCWYKNIFFRSLKELSFFINVIDAQKLSWESGERRKYTIKYFLNGKERTYRPDFIINSSSMVEIKPQSLHDSIIVKAKRAAALNFCNLNNLTYELIDIIVDYSQIQKLYMNGEITPLIKYKSKFDNFLSSHYNFSTDCNSS